MAWIYRKIFEESIKNIIIILISKSDKRLHILRQGQLLEILFVNWSLIQSIEILICNNQTDVCNKISIDKINLRRLHHLIIPLEKTNQIVLILIKMIQISTVYRLLIWNLSANVKEQRVSCLVILNQIDLSKN